MKAVFQEAARTLPRGMELVAVRKMDREYWSIHVRYHVNGLGATSVASIHEPAVNLANATDVLDKLVRRRIRWNLKRVAL